MSEQRPGRPHGGPADHPGAATADEGTPVPVGTRGDPRWWGTVAVLLAGPLIWTAHFFVVYLVAEAGCTGDGPGLRLFDPPVPYLTTLVATAVAAAASAAMIAVGRRRWQALRRADSGGVDERGAALALGGALLSALSLIQVLFVGIPALVLPGC